MSAIEPLNRRIMAIIIAERIHPEEALTEIGMAYAKAIAAASQDRVHAHALAAGLGGALAGVVEIILDALESEDVGR